MLYYKVLEYEIDSDSGPYDNKKIQSLDVTLLILPLNELGTV